MKKPPAKAAFLQRSAGILPAAGGGRSPDCRRDAGATHGQLASPPKNRNARPSITLLFFWLAPTSRSS